LSPLRENASTQLAASTETDVTAEPRVSRGARHGQHEMAVTRHGGTNEGEIEGEKVIERERGGGREGGREGEIEGK
jgi:hypothetical protein